MDRRDIDIAILGGGLAGGLIALALARLRPELTLLLIEQGERFGGNHVWSFFASDIEQGDEWLVEPLVAARWNGYDVHFPGHSRRLATPYRSITSERLDAALRAALPPEALLTGASVARAGQESVMLADGQTIRAGGVIDARGSSAMPHMAGGWQKFLGRMLRLERPHGLSRPVVMDARVDQCEGYRFVYCLPFSDTELFVEDTYYTDGPELDLSALRLRIAAYAETQGWQVAEVLREEIGVLPVIAGGEFAAFWPAGDGGPARAGARGALFHPLTSYSLPDAVRFARHLSALPDLWGASLAEAGYAWAQAHWRQGSFYRMLTRMLFGAARPEHRFRLLERFYRLPEGLIERFYAGRSTRTDALRILAGKPPVPVSAALASLLGRGRPLSPARTASVKRACVIGAGFGGLALALRLQSNDIATTLIEARDKPGGRAYYWERDGFTFDAGPTVITDPACLAELWQLSGRDMADDIELMPVMPFYRLNWPDGTNFDYSNDEASLRREIARIAPEDLAGYDEFLAYSAAVYQEGYVRLGHVPFLDFTSMVRAAPALARHQAWRSVYSMVSSYMKHEKLREAFSFHTLLVGGNPMTTSAIYALIHKLEKDGGVWWAKGGTNRLIAAMAKHFERLGGTIRLHDPVVRVHTIGDHASEVETASGWQERFDAVASNADIVHSYRDLLADCPRGPAMAHKLAKKRFSPSLFIVHFGLEGSWPGIPHHMILFGPRYEGLLTDIYEHGVLPRDFSIYLHHPTVTDPSVAPPGKSTFYALVPVAHMGKLPVDWEQVGPLLEQRILDEVGRRLIPDIHDRIVTKFHYAPRDFALDLNAWHGSAFSLEPILTQSAWFRGHNRDDKIRNFYLVGAGTHPGAGIPGVVGSAKATAKLMLEDLR